MCKYRFLTGLFILTSVLSSSAAQANAEPFDCSFDIKGTTYPAQCDVRDINEPGTGNNLALHTRISLQPLINGFETLLKAKLHKRTCEERVDVKSATLTVENGQLIANAKIWFEKRHCSSLIKTKLIEKTADIVVSFKPQYNNQEIRLVTHVVNSGFSEFEETILRSFGHDPREAIKRSLDEALSFNLAQTKLPSSLQQSIQFSSLQINNTPPRLDIGLTLKLDAQSLTELLQFWFASR